MTPPDNQVDLKDINGIQKLVDEGGYEVETLLSVLNALSAIKKNDAKKEKDKEDECLEELIQQLYNSK